MPVLSSPTSGATRREKLRRAVASPWMLAGAVAVGGASVLATPFVAPAVGFGYLGARLGLGARHRRFYRELGAAYQPFERGDPSAVVEFCNAAAKGVWPISHLAAAELGRLTRRLGDLDGAIELLGKTAASDDGTLREFLATELSACYALKGVTGAAMTWLPERRWSRTTQAASVAVVWARTGRAVDVGGLRLARPGWLASSLQHERRLLALMRAFALYKSDPNDDRVGPIALDAGPAFAGEFTYMGSSWPEMAEFLAAHLPATPRI